MRPLLGLAGIAEAAAAFELAAFWVAFLFVSLVALLAFGLRSRGVAISAVILWTFVSLLVAPWRAYLPLTELEQRDYDIVYWSSQLHGIAIAWILEWVWIVAVMTLAVIYRRNVARDNEEISPR